MVKKTNTKERALRQTQKRHTAKQKLAVKELKDTIGKDKGIGKIAGKQLIDRLYD